MWYPFGPLSGFFEPGFLLKNTFKRFIASPDIALSEILHAKDLENRMIKEHKGNNLLSDLGFYSNFITWVNLKVNQGLLSSCTLLLCSVPCFYFRQQPGEAELLVPQRTDPQEEGKCVWRKAIYVLVWVWVCMCVRGREREREVVLLPCCLHFLSHQWASVALFLPFRPLLSL